MKEEEEEGKAEAAEEPRPEPAEGTQLESDKASPRQAVEGLDTGDGDREPGAQEAEPPKPEREGEPDPELDLRDSVEEGLELDRMEVKPAEEIPQEPVEPEEPIIIEPPVPAQEETDRPGVLAMLADYWIWVVAFLLGLSVVSAAFLFVLAPKGESSTRK